jgi:hypothetical protein
MRRLHRDAHGRRRSAPAGSPRRPLPRPPLRDPARPPPLACGLRTDARRRLRHLPGVVGGRRSQRVDGCRRGRAAELCRFGHDAPLRLAHPVPSTSSRCHLSGFVGVLLDMTSRIDDRRRVRHYCLEVSVRSRALRWTAIVTLLVGLLAAAGSAVAGSAGSCMHGSGDRAGTQHCQWITPAACCDQPSSVSGSNPLPQPTAAIALLPPLPSRGMVPRPLGHASISRQPFYPGTVVLRL